MAETIRDSFLDVKRFLATAGLCMTLLLTILPAQAGVWIQTAASITRTSDGPSGAETNDTRLISSSTIGYSFIQGFMIGGQYLFARASQAGAYSSAWGPKGGLLIRGFELTAAFLPSARDYPDGVTLRTGAGYALNLGYSTRILGAMRAGLQFTYWSMNFSERAGQELAIRERQTYLAPQLSLGFEL